MKKKILAVLMIFCMTMSIPVSAKGLTGVCGNNVTYSFDRKTDVLTIAGNGSLYNYEWYNDLPWYGYSNRINHVNLDAGVKAPLWTLNKKIAIACGKVKKETIKPQKKTEIILPEDTESVISGDVMDSNLH